eukprot:TRINITY_DN2174_c0_g5_i1.p1 TRINITY_DN2174_c0_g5~~TRINITY_DN2174_c0_g5_i1.p1  ORF type:complete len:445 (-),score=67.70 TRINITY_DN2174_c0_g5_i1:514-1794(-)
MSLSRAGSRGNSRTGFNRNTEDSAAACVAPDAFQTNRPTTPPELKRFRKLSKMEPGVKTLHWGHAEVPIRPDMAFGAKVDKGERAADLIRSNVGQTALQQHLIEQKESVYKSHRREPLARVPDPRDPLPAFVQSEDFRFGISNSEGADETGAEAKLSIYPENRLYAIPKNNQTIQQEQEVTKPISRGYKWDSVGIDPKEHRFGRTEPGNSLSKQGMGVKLALNEEVNTSTTRVVNKRQQDFKEATTDRLARTRNVQAATEAELSGRVFGRSTGGRDEWGAKQCIHGAYAPEQQQPDPDLGRRTTKAKYDIPASIASDSNHVFGTSSIRRDRPAPALRSVANFTNYGDEVGARDLLKPSRFAFDGLDEQDFTRSRQADEIRSIFSNIGHDFTDQEFNQLCVMATADNQPLNIETFRKAFNRVRLGIM